MTETTMIIKTILTILGLTLSFAGALQLALIPPPSHDPTKTYRYIWGPAVGMLIAGAVLLLISGLW